jgi:hypothetical protein
MSANNIMIKPGQSLPPDILKVRKYLVLSYGLTVPISAVMLSAAISRLYFGTISVTHLQIVICIWGLTFINVAIAAGLTAHASSTKLIHVLDGVMKNPQGSDAAAKASISKKFKRLRSFHYIYRIIVCYFSAPGVILLSLPLLSDAGIIVFFYCESFIMTIAWLVMLPVVYIINP